MHFKTFSFYKRTKFEIDKIKIKTKKLKIFTLTYANITRETNACVRLYIKCKPVNNIINLILYDTFDHLYYYVTFPLTTFDSKLCQMVYSKSIKSQKVCS